jgi:alkylhydroperoxidase family enzyme
VGRQGGIDEEKLRGLAGWQESSAFTGEERLALALADAMTATPFEVPDDLYAALRSRYDEGQIVELVSSIAWENYRARFDHALGLEAEGYSEGAYCPLPSPQNRVST